MMAFANTTFSFMEWIDNVAVDPYHDSRYLPFIITFTAPGALALDAAIQEQIDKPRPWTKRTKRQQL